MKRGTGKAKEPEAIHGSKKRDADLDACETLEGKRGAGRVQCPLCGNRFEPVEAEACKYCPKLFKSCGMLACPNCGHEFPRP